MALVYIDQNKDASVIWVADDAFALSGLMHHSANRIIGDSSEY